MRVPLLATAVAATVSAVLFASCGQASDRSRAGTAAADTVAPNDNRVAAGAASANVRRIHLEARAAAWRPDPSVDSLVTVFAFAERGQQAQIPGPMIRVHEGTDVEITLHNTLDSTLLVHGLRGEPFTTDTLTLATGETRTLRYRASKPGTYLYWGTSTHASVDRRTWRDSQLTGAIVIDPRGVPIDTAERIFVMTVIDVVPDDTVRNPRKEDIWELSINGRSWPHTERMTHTVGDTVRWRWINGSYLPHPMHLHGFHFRVTAAGDNNRDSSYAVADHRVAVTEAMMPGATFRMDWVPTRAGHWLMHCHMLPHITPFPERPDSARHHDVHDVAAHPLSAMAGLVLGITTVDRTGVTAVHAPTHHLRLLAQRSRVDSGMLATRAFALHRTAEPRSDSVEVPGPLLLLRRGQTTAITVVNRNSEPTTVHWHGMELESVFDGVSGWSRSGTSIAPLLAPGDSFTAIMTPPRAGTYMYHTHMDEGLQLRTGMYGPLVVLDSGEMWNSSTDLPFMVGEIAEGKDIVPAINGRKSPASRTLQVGTTYRLRFINILPAPLIDVSLVGPDSSMLTWVPRAKDGADLPSSRRIGRSSRQTRIGVGETYDFEFTPTREMDAQLVVHIARGGPILRQPLRIRH